MFRFGIPRYLHPRVFQFQATIFYLLGHRFFLLGGTSFNFRQALCVLYSGQNTIQLSQVHCIILGTLDACCVSLSREPNLSSREHNYFVLGMNNVIYWSVSLNSLSNSVNDQSHIWLVVDLILVVTYTHSMDPLYHGVLSLPPPSLTPPPPPPPIYPK